MNTVHTVESLIAFERDIAEQFNAGHIRAPVHLAGGNERPLLHIFGKVKPSDWVCTQWRSHYHCLLKGVAPKQVRSDILAGKSITLNYPEHRIVSSAIVGGVLPIALGLAKAMKLIDFGQTVWCFVGDMTATTGAFSEAACYAVGHDLPIHFIIEDNGLSVCTETQPTWGPPGHPGFSSAKVTQYQYKLPWPHAGAGKRVQF